jgi:hypothetical protein
MQVVAPLHCTPCIGKQVLDADHIPHLDVRMNSVGMHDAQWSYPNLQTSIATAGCVDDLRAKEWRGIVVNLPPTITFSFPVLW